MAEARIEKDFARRVEDAGGKQYKFTSPGRRGVADRIALFPVPEEHRPIVAKYLRFVELKDEGKHPEPHQEREHKRLRDMGFVVDVVDYVGYQCPR
jgi:hypothetical protein